MLRVLGAAGAALSLMVLPTAGAQVPDDGPARPNVLIIVTDDQRIGSMGALPVTTRLFGTGGTKFTDAFATTPLCCPARASIMTGLYAHNHGIVTQEGTTSAGFDQTTTIQKELHDAGYRTGIYGKFLNGWNLGSSPEHFDRWGIFSHVQPDGYSGGVWNVDGSLRRVDRYSTGYIRSRAISFLTDSEADDEQPWYLYLAPAAPHAPFEAQSRYRDMPVRRWDGNPAVFEEDRTDKPAWVRERSQGIRRGRSLRTKQLRTLKSVDDAVDRIFAALDELDEDRDTVAFFLSDNGFLWGEHGLTEKRFPYLPSVKVPFYARWPDTIDEGRRDNRLVANIDIAPTIYEAAGVTPDYTADGRSLLQSDSRERLLLEFWRVGDTSLPTWAATITEAFQYVEYYSNEGLPLGAEYYDLTTDPWQLDNLLGDSEATNDPNVPVLSLQLSLDRGCEGSDCP